MVIKSYASKGINAAVATNTPFWNSVHVWRWAAIVPAQEGLQLVGTPSLALVQTHCCFQYTANKNVFKYHVDATSGRIKKHQPGCHTTHELSLTQDATYQAIRTAQRINVLKVTNRKDLQCTYV